MGRVQLARSHQCGCRDRRSRAYAAGFARPSRSTTSLGTRRVGFTAGTSSCDCAMADRVGMIHSRDVGWGSAPAYASSRCTSTATAQIRPGWRTARCLSPSRGPQTGQSAHLQRHDGRSGRARVRSRHGSSDVTGLVSACLTWRIGHGFDPPGPVMAVTACSSSATATDP